MRSLVADCIQKELPFSITLKNGEKIEFLYGKPFKTRRFNPVNKNIWSLSYEIPLQLVLTDTETECLETVYLYCMYDSMNDEPFKYAIAYNYYDLEAIFKLSVFDYGNLVKSSDLSRIKSIIRDAKKEEIEKLAKDIILSQAEL